MALWPFRRRSDRKRSRSGAALSDAEGPQRSQTEGVIARSDLKKKQRVEPGKRRARTYSFSPGRNDNIRIEGARERAFASSAQPLSSTAASWERTPTLHHKPQGKQMGRTRSSKRRKPDHGREAEIKAMSNFAPIRAATDQWATRRPVKKGSKRGRSTWNNHPVSDDSLPMPTSLRSSLSSDSEFGSYRVSAFDSLAPRPTLRYAPGTRWSTSRASVLARSTSQKRQMAERIPLEEVSEKPRRRIDELADDLDASDLRELMERDKRRREKKRTHDQQRMERRLARRQENQRASEAEARKTGTPPPENLERGVMGRELQGIGIDPASAVRTSTKHRSSDDGSQDGSTEPMSKNPSEIFQDAQDEPATAQPDVAKETLPEQEEPTAVEKPSKDIQMRDEPSQSTEAAETWERDEAVDELPQATKFAGLLRSKKSRSKSTLGSDKDRNMHAASSSRADDDEDMPRKSSTSSSKARFSLSALLRRGAFGRRASRPASFSNTSREEMQSSAAAQSQSHLGSHTDGRSSATHVAFAQAQALAKLEGHDPTPASSPTPTGNFLSRKPSEGSKRTKSRFREDLPEFPLSPPDSRVQSPEVEAPLPTVAEQKPEEGNPHAGESRDGVQTARQFAADSARPIPVSGERNVGAGSPDPHMSVSLASIDSEGSWLSGRVGSRRTSTIRDSIARSGRRPAAPLTDSPYNSTQEDLAIVEDDYLAGLTPRRHSAGLGAGRRSGEGRPSSDEGDFGDDPNDEHMNWGAVGARPRMVHDRQTMQSQEVILNMIDDAGESPVSPVSPISPVSADERADVQRARSVHLGRTHARNFSAGSAKLLDLTRRGSTDSEAKVREKRRSAPLNL